MKSSASEPGLTDLLQILGRVTAKALSAFDLKKSHSNADTGKNLYDLCK